MRRHARSSSSGARPRARPGHVRRGNARVQDSPRGVERHAGLGDAVAEGRRQRATGSTSLRGFSRLALRLFPTERRAEGQRLPGGRELRDRGDRRQGGSSVQAGAPRPPRPQRRDHPGPARRAARPASGGEDRRRRARRPRTLGTGRAPDGGGAADDHRARPERGACRRGTGALGAGQRGRGEANLPARADADRTRCSSFRRRRAGSRSSAAAAANAYFAQLDSLVGRPAQERPLRGATAAASSSSRESGPRPRRAPHGGRRPRRRRARQQPRRAPRRSAPSRPAGRRPRRRRWGSPASSASYETFYGGIANRIHNVELVAHLVDNKLIAPGATFSFNDATGDRTAAKGFVEAPVIINGELSDRARRRRLPGLDDGLQRRLRGRAADHGPDESRAVHLALPARPRRDRRLSGHRPEVRERHGPLAAAPDVRRRLVARRLALRNAAAPARRHEDRTAEVRRRRRRSRRRSTRRSRRERAWSTTPASRPLDLGRAARSMRPTGSCSPTAPGTRTTARARRSCSSARSRSRRSRSRSRRPRPRRLRRLPDAAGSGRSQPAIASRSHCGRPGRAQRRRIDGAVCRPAVGDHRPVALDRVLESEPRAAHVEAARVDEQPVVEHGRREEAHVRLEHERLDPLVAQALVAAGDIARGTRRAPPRTRRGSSSCARRPGRRSRRSARGSPRRSG